MDEGRSRVEVCDPALAEAALEGDRDDEIAVLARLTDPDRLPEGVRVVTRFGDVVTLRVRRDRAAELTESDLVAHVEVARKLRKQSTGPPEEDGDGAPGVEEAADLAEVAGIEAVVSSDYTRRPLGVSATGKGCVVGILDWGCDFAHPAFRHEDGSTRLLALWDQRDDDRSAPNNRWGYGRVLTRDDINRALSHDDPYGALDYDPSVTGRRRGAHGTHVMDIAAGSGLGGGMPGVAPQADLVFVHLSRTTEVLGRGNLGDSATVLEALDFVFSIAEDRPCVVNMSVGAHGGPHDGMTLLEQGIDRAVSLQSGRAVVCSAGNYFRRSHHTQGRVTPGGEKVLPFIVPAGDPTDSELEVWYAGTDRFTATVIDPSGTTVGTVDLGQNGPLMVGGRAAGYIYHQARRTLNGDHQIDLFLRPRAPGGTWQLRLKGDAVQDGRYHVWIERDRGLQPRFLARDCVLDSTTGTLCNGRLSITVGACEARGGSVKLGSFSSAGPTRDGREKPEIVAPGVRIRAARSAPPGESPGARYTIMSGTSMAAPHVTGAIALMFEAAGRPLGISDARALLFDSADRTPFAGGVPDAVDLHRYGYGCLDIAAVERAAREWGHSRADEERAEPESTGHSDGDLDTEQTEAICAEQDGEAMDTEETEAGLEEWDGEDLGTEQEGDALEVERADAGLEAWDPEDVRAEAADGEQADMGSPVPDTVGGLGPVDTLSLREALRDALAATATVTTAEQLRKLAFSAMGASENSESAPVGRPGTVLEETVQPGDMLERSAPLEGVTHSAIIISERPESAAELTGRGVPVERGGAGAYVEVIEVPCEGGPPRSMGRRLTDAWGRLPRGQTLRRATEAVYSNPPDTADLLHERDAAFVPGTQTAHDATAHFSAPTTGLEERIDIDDITQEMNGLPCRFVEAVTRRRADGTTCTFRVGSVHTIGDWNGVAADATIDRCSVPKIAIEPHPDGVATIRRYAVSLNAQRSAVRRNTDTLRAWRGRKAQFRRNRAAWEREERRLVNLLDRRQLTYNRMWIRQMMYNQFDRTIAAWTRHYNNRFNPHAALDPNIVKSLIYQESRMGTSGLHLMPPPYSWASSDQHPIRSRFNIGQALDSWGPQQWLMMEEMAPTIFARHGLGALAAGRRWLGMSDDDYASHPTFMTALREFFEHRDGGQNLMGTGDHDLHEDYSFWIRTAIRWLFVKFSGLSRPSWAEAVRAYNGDGPRARRYRRAVMARVGSTAPYAAEAMESAPSAVAEADGIAIAQASLEEDAPRMDSSATLTWEDLSRVTDSRGQPQVFYVVTGAPASVARSGDEGKAIFHLRVRNTNAVYNHLNVATKYRVLDILPNRQFREVMPWRRFSGPDLEDESSRVIKLSLGRQTLLSAYNPDSPLTRLEAEYHWREVWERAQRHYNRTGLDFMLVAPIEYLFSRRQRLTTHDIELRDPTRHKADFWIPVTGVNFTADIRQPVTIQLDVTSSVSGSATGQQTTSTRRTRSTTRSSSTSNTFSVQVNGEVSQGGSAKASIEVLELGVQEMFKLGASLGYSRTRTDTSSSAVAREFTRSLMLSRTYATSQAVTSRTTLIVSPPELPQPRGTGTRSEPRVRRAGIGSVGVYLYPLVAFFEVPYVRFEDVNAMGQATRRSEGLVAVPFVTEWRLTSHRGG